MFTADSGLVSREQRGKWAYYRVNPEALDRLAVVVSTHSMYTN